MAWVLTLTVNSESSRNDDGDEIEQLTGRLWELGTSGVAIDGSCLVAGFESQTDAMAARAELGGMVEAVDPNGWRTPEPTTLDIGGRAMTIDSGRSFGHGTHPTTQLCLRALARHVPPDRSVLDVGCGSGVLALAAAQLGAGSVTAIDISGDAVDATRANALRNGIELDVSTTNIADLSGSFDIVVANILIVELEPIAQHVVRLADGVIVVSGALVTQRDRVLRALTPSATLIEESVDGEWLGATFQIGE